MSNFYENNLEAVDKHNENPWCHGAPEKKLSDYYNTNNFNSESFETPTASDYKGYHLN